MENLIAYRIKNSRKLKGLSQQEIADELNISKQMVSKYEKGISMPTSSKLIKLAQLFNLKIDYFFSPFKVDIGEVYGQWNFKYNRNDRNIRFSKHYCFIK